jgi:hypothetical protein
MLIKITEVVVQDRVLRIRDQFRMVLKENSADSGRRNIGSFGRRNNYTDKAKMEKPDTKNLIKNIINLFHQWLRNGNSEIGGRANKKLNQIAKHMKYFNKLLIQELSRNRDICLCFLEFAKLYSELAIQESRIRDKTCHLKAMRNYVRLFEEGLSKLDKEAKTASISTNE